MNGAPENSPLWISAFAMLLCAAAFAGDVSFHVGFTGVQTMNTPGGFVQYSDLQIGSNERPADAATHHMNFRLEVNDGSGATVCEVGSVLDTTVRPSIRPMRFQVLEQSAPKGLIRPRTYVRKYTLNGSILGGSATNHTAWVAEFTIRGTPSCQILMTSGQ